MIHPEIEKLLFVQEKDLIFLKISQEIERIPQERALIENLIAKETEATNLARTDLNDKEVARKDLDNQVKGRESDIQKFRTQQLEVKKNDEYQALTHQIEQAQADISRFEEAEIELMYAIDQARENFEAAKKVIDHRIEVQNQQIVQLELRLKQLKDSAEGAQTEYMDSRVAVTNDFIEAYDRTRSQTKRPPYVVKIEHQNCGGCHLRVSNDVLTMASSSQEAVLCDQCSRIVFKA